MEQKLETNVDEAWETGLDSWHDPSVPYVITPRNSDEIIELGEIGEVLAQEMAFMKYPEFQTYQNLERIVETFPEDPQRGLTAVSKHEIGHRYCPYDKITLLILNHTAKKALQERKAKVDPQGASGLVVNLFTDMCINTNLVRQGDEDLPWAYQQISRDKADSSMWKVYGRSMELAWDKPILPDWAKLNDREQEAAEQLSRLFDGEYFDKGTWKAGVREYAQIIAEFLEQKEGKGSGQGKEGKGEGNKGESGMGTGFDDTMKNLPRTLDDKTAKDLAKRVAEIGSNGLPTNPAGIEEFKEIMAGMGQGNPTQASIHFYNMLSGSYDVMFATQPFGRPRVNPFQPIKWTPGMGADELDVGYSAQVGGKIIPGVNTHSWNTRKREIKGGLEEVIPNLDIYLDSSGSMPNPVNSVSLPVLAGFVVAKKALRKGAKVRSTNFSGNGQYATADFTTDSQPIFKNLTTHYGGGTVFPAGKLLESDGPKQVLIITDTFVANEQEVGDAISQLRRRNKLNRVTIYAIHPVVNAEYLRRAGAEVIHGTTTEIFRKVIGRATEVYSGR